MSNGNYTLIVDGSAIPLRRIDNIRLVTPARDERQATIAARLSKSTRIALDPGYPNEYLVVWGDKEKLKEIRSYRDVKNTRSAFLDPQGNLLVLTNDILISFKEESSDEVREQRLAKYDGKIIERKSKFWKFRVNDPGEDAPLLLSNELSKESIVKYAEPNALQAMILHQLPQNEPQFGNQWHLQNIGQNGGLAGADVDALGAWARTTGRQDVRIAIIDVGVDINHPDLNVNIGPGWDFDNDDNDPTNDNAPHGTACAGIMVAAANGLGVVGIAPGCQLIPLRIAGQHSTETWADAFDWAAARSKIISFSGGLTPFNVISDAIRRAVYDNGVAIFCAVGNSGTNGISYPASLNETIAVGASTNNDVRAGYSQYGIGLDFLAPSSGGTLQIETTDIQGSLGDNIAGSPAGDYCNANNLSGFGGTSAATPLAAGTAALMLSIDPEMSPFGIRQILRGAATKIDAANADYDTEGWSSRYGYGRINAALAVRRSFRPQRVIDNFGYEAGGWRVERHPRFLADLRGAGLTDVVGFGNAGVYIALNNGNARFQPVERVIDNFGYNAGGWRVEKHPRFLADLTGNGIADIIGFGNAGVYVSLNNGNGTFQPASRVLDNFGYNAGGWRVEKHPRFLADLTGDGRADIVGFGNAGVYVALNNGNGTFQPARRVLDNFGYNAGGWRVERHPRFLADLTGDGRADIVGFGNAGVYVALNNGDGTFQPARRVIDNFGYETGGWRVEMHPRFVAKLRTNRADIIGFGDAGVYVALNNGNGTFQPVRRVLESFGYEAGGWRIEMHPRYVADLTGDGRADIVGFGSVGVFVAFNNGNGSFQAPQMVVSNFAFKAGGWLVERHPRFVADLTTDGRADIVGFGNAGVYVRTV